MTLISMLLALIIERLAVRSDAWQARPYCQAYLKLTASSGLSKLPLQLLKHLGPPGMQCLANFLNASAIA